MADITFAFNNGKMLKYLIKRAQYLSKTEFTKALKVEHKLTALKNKKYEELVTPIYFYCTFMNSEGISEAMEREKLTFLDKYSIKLQVARSPSDLLWLNRDVSRRKARIYGYIIALVAICIVLVCGYLFSTELGLQIYISYRKDPPAQNCKQLD